MKKPSLRCDMNTSTLDEARQVNDMAKIQDYMYSKNQIEFDKVRLAGELANFIVCDIHNKKDRNESSVEKEIRKIMQWSRVRQQVNIMNVGIKPNDVTSCHAAGRLYRIGNMDSL